MTKPTVGLTGGIASGKSTVARIFADLGVGVVDADAIAREVVAPGSEGLAEVVETFGTGVLAPDGSLDRKKLGGIVFADADARAKLNAITHPRIGRLSTERMAALADGPVPYLMYEAALLVETGIFRSFSALVVVAVPRSVQVDRLMRRDGIEQREAEARIDAQLPLEEKTKVADYVIDNSGSDETTRREVTRVHHELRTRFEDGGKNG